MDEGRSAADRAYDEIKSGILRGRTAAGSMLGEVALAEWIGVSRTPVRAALTRLQDEGWITIYPKRGALVRGLDQQDVADLTEARLILESAAVGRVDIAARDELADRLLASIDAQRAAFAAEDLPGFVEQTIRFHREFVAASGNAVLRELSERLADRQRYLLFRHGDRLLARCADILAEHETLVDRLRAGDAAGFAAALDAHLAETHDVPLRG